MTFQKLHQRTDGWGQTSIKTGLRLWVGFSLAVAVSGLSGCGLLSDSAIIDAQSEEAPSFDEEMPPEPLEVLDDAQARKELAANIAKYKNNRHPRGKLPTALNTHERGGQESIMCALRWLKLQQKPDGSWPGEPTSMTGLALLAFLRRGETPNPDCVEFGPTVEKGIRYLVENQNDDGTFKSKDKDNYAHPIATLALCEAYSLTKVPLLKDIAEKALRPIIHSQNPSGGWDLNLKQSNVNNTSYMGWCAQAIKAAHVDGNLEVEGLNAVYTNAVNGFKANAHQDGGFGKIGKGQSDDSGAGVFCMMILGDSRSEEVSKTLSLLDGCTFSFENWENQPVQGESPIGNWYYITQARFHAGGERYLKWHTLHSPEVITRQVILTNAIVDAEGRLQDVGYWDSPSKNEHYFGSGGDVVKDTHYERGVAVDGTTTLGARVQDTCLSLLPIAGWGLRYLPTFKKPALAEIEVASTNETDDIKITLTR